MWSDRTQNGSSDLEYHDYAITLHTCSSLPFVCILHDESQGYSLWPIARTLPSFLFTGTSFGVVDGLCSVFARGVVVVGVVCDDLASDVNDVDGWKESAYRIAQKVEDEGLQGWD